MTTKAKVTDKHITDRRERILSEALDLYGPRIFATKLAGLLIGAGQLLLEHSLYPDRDDKYNQQLRAADVDLVAHFMASMFCPLLDEWDTAMTLRMDHIEKWIKSDRMKKEYKRDERRKANL